MNLINYDALDSTNMDILREIGSIGTGNAANALSSMLGQEVRIDLPEVRIMRYNEAIEWIGGPGEITAGVLVQLGGEINGIMLSVQKIEYINLLLSNILGKTISDYSELGELEISALIEVSNIMISAFINALSQLTDMSINLTVPAFTVDMQGAILAVPMAVYGGQSDYIMTIGSDFICDKKNVPCRLLLSPDIRSLNILMRKVCGEDG